MKILQQRTLIIFTKYPRPGLVKTRLIPVLGEIGAANLQQWMTAETLQKMQSLSQDDIDIYIYFTGSSDRAMQEMFGDFNYCHQCTGNLGERMFSAFSDLLGKVSTQVILIGCDCPDLTPNFIRQGFEQLNDRDLVLGKAADGGYYLIGLKQVIPQLFQEISWGSDLVLSQTSKIAEKLSLSIAYLPILHDIDRPEDLNLLASEYSTRATEPL